MRFEVPQFIDIEDKIFGPLTWRQFLYMGGGVGLGVVLFLTANFFVFLLVGLPLAILAGALAFYPVNNRPFSFFLESMVNYLMGTKLYIWKKTDEMVYQYESRYQPVLPQTTPETPVVVVFKAPLARRLEMEAINKDVQ